MRIGIIGAGQLGRMLAMAGIDLGMEFVFLDPASEPSAARLGRHLQANFDDPQALDEIASSCDVITYEFENVPATSIDHLSARHSAVFPPPASLRIAQQRDQEKTFFESQDILVAPWARAASQAELNSAAARIGLPVIAKTNRLGYDGKGQRKISESQGLKTLFADMGNVDLCLEQWLEFDGEVSLIGVRGRNGEVRTYPLSQNEHRDGILWQSRVPGSFAALQAQADEIFERMATALGYVGTLTIEFFVVNGALVANEIAPRVHNSGHWSIEGATTSQFENHLRAICDLPLGETTVFQPTGMRNFVSQIPPAADVLKHPGVAYHSYDKIPRIGRKLGHATVVAASAELRDDILQKLEEVAPWDSQ